MERKKSFLFKFITICMLLCFAFISVGCLGMPGNPDGFESDDDNRDIMVQDSFCSNYNKWLNKQQTRTLYSDSVTGIVKKDLSKSEQFENLLEESLYGFNEYYDNFVSLLKQIIKCLVFPLEYTVYEKNNQNFIVINSLEENESVKNICKKYNLFTVAKE